jgi:ribosomal RNA methyltransferase Nop2
MEGVMNNKSPKSLQLDDDSDDEDDEFAGLGDDSEDDDGDEPEQTPPNFASPSESEEEGASDSDSDSDSDSESEDEEALLPIEKKARKEDARRLKEAEDAAAEQVMDLNVEGDDDDDDDDDDAYKLEPTSDDDQGGDGGAVPDLQRVQARIQDVVRVLQDFKSRREEGRSRGEYVDRLVADLATYYGYNTFLTRYFIETFSVAETMELLEGASRRVRRLTAFHTRFATSPPNYHVRPIPR